MTNAAGMLLLLLPAFDYAASACHMRLAHAYRTCPFVIVHQERKLLRAHTIISAATVQEREEDAWAGYIHVKVWPCPLIAAATAPQPKCVESDPETQSTCF